MALMFSKVLILSPQFRSPKAPKFKKLLRFQLGLQQGPSFAPLWDHFWAPGTQGAGGRGGTFFTQIPSPPPKDRMGAPSAFYFGSTRGLHPEMVPREGPARALKRRGEGATIFFAPPPHILEGLAGSWGSLDPGLSCDQKSAALLRHWLISSS